MTCKCKQLRRHKQTKQSAQHEGGQPHMSHSNYPTAIPPALQPSRKAPPSTRWPRKAQLQRKPRSYSRLQPKLDYILCCTWIPKVLTTNDFAIKVRQLQECRNGYAVSEWPQKRDANCSDLTASCWTRPLGCRTSHGRRCQTLRRETFWPRALYELPWPRNRLSQLNRSIY